jgi:CPA1 family monovalent cation:H+ antiporter
MSIFWDMIDTILTGVLFVLIGLVIFALDFDLKHMIAGICAIVIVLAARYISVFVPYRMLRHPGENVRHTIQLLTWGGLRGGISIALALSITDIGYVDDAIVTMTYVVVIFSLLVQGLTLKGLAHRLDLDIPDEPTSGS